jgi:hypothetical protein
MTHDGQDSPVNPHFETAASWGEAEAMLSFQPRQPRDTAGRRLQAFRVHVRDHRLRELAVVERTFEAHYDGFVLSQARKGTAEARRLALDVSYGQAGYDARIVGRSARVYDLGPEPPRDDIDGRNPSVVAWHDGEVFYLVASGEMRADELLGIAMSMYS